MNLIVKHVNNQGVCIMSNNVPAGIQFIADGESRPKASEKKVINGTCDVNQLEPFAHEWAWKKYIQSLGNHWTPMEISMLADIDQWRDPKLLTDAERRIVMRNLGFFATADSVVVNNLVLSIYRHITSPECRQFLLRQAFEEALHTHSYQHVIQSLGLDQGEVFNMYHEVDSIREKSNWALPFSQSLADPNFNTGKIEDDRRFLRDLIVFFLIFEGIFFYVGFVQILSMGRRGLMVGTSEQFQYILRDESMHLNFGVDLINQIIMENPSIWNNELEQEVYKLISEGVELEYAYAVDTMPDGILGLNKSTLYDYLKYIANRRLEQIGLKPLYKNTFNPFPWMSEMMDLKKEKNFFETRVTEYQTGGFLSWDSEDDS